MAVCYAFGTVWLAKLLSLSFKEGLMMGVIPYLPGDAAKIIIAAIVGPKLTVQHRKFDSYIKNLEEDSHFNNNCY